MRKLLSLVLASAMVVSSFSMSFAAPSAVTNTKLVENVENDNVVEAVKRLNAFGIVDGMEDGEYHPEKQVTREQFAKLVVEALGLGKAAEAAKGTSVFKDVEAGRWSAGYISVAAGQGIIKGDGTGNFNPSTEVNYAEAITMLVRALGYQDEFLVGTWPGNYVAKAAELDITDDVEYASTSANRGDVAIMVNNTLDAKLIKVNAYKNGEMEYSEKGVTLLEDKLDATKISDLRVVATSDVNTSLEKDEVKLIALDDDIKIDGDELSEKVSGAETFEYKGVANFDGLLGHEVNAYFDGDEIVYVESDTSDKNIYRGVAFDDEKDGTMVIEGGAVDYYDWADNVAIYVNNKITNFKADKDDKIENKFENEYTFANRIVVDGDEIVFADLVQFDKTSIMVKEVDLKKETITYFGTTEDVNDKKLKLEDGYDITTVDGSKIELKDIEVNDMLYVYEDKDDEDITHIIAGANDVVTGELDKYKNGYAKTGHDRASVWINGEKLDVANKFAFDNDDDIDNLDYLDSADTDLGDSLDDVCGEEVTVTKDIKGRVAFMSTDVEIKSDDYAVVLGYDKKYGDTELKVWNMNDAKAFYTFDEGDDDITLSTGDIDVDKEDVLGNITTALEANAEKVIVKYDLNSNGDKIEILDYWIIKNNNDVFTANDVVLDKLDDDDTFKDDTVKTTGPKYYNESNSVYLDFSKYFTNDDDGDLEAVEWSELDDNNGDAKTYVLVVKDAKNSHREIEFMAFMNDYDVSDGDIMSGYVVEVSRNKDNKEVVIDVVGEGVKTYLVDKDDDFKAEDVIYFKEKGENDIKLVTDTDYDKIGAVKVDGTTRAVCVIKEIDGKFLDVVYHNGTKFVTEDLTIAPDAVVYKKEKDKDTSDLEENYMIRILVKDGDILAIKYLDDEKYEVKDGKIVEVEDEE